MKNLDNVTLVHNPAEIFDLFLRLFPEMKPEVSGWQVLEPFTDSYRGILLHFTSGSRLVFSVRLDPEENSWSVGASYLIPAHVPEVPEKLLASTPAADVGPVESLEDLVHLLCEMCPEFRYRVTGVQKWRRFNSHYRGAMISLTDRKKILFAEEKKDGLWNATWPILVPSPDEEMIPLGEAEQIVLSDWVIFLE